MTNEPSHDKEEDPGFQSVRNFLLYSLSMPERTLRSASGVVGGALRESASLLVPQAFQNSKTYSVMVRQMLDFMAEDIGGVESDKTDDAPPKIDNYVARKTVGNFIDLAGLATLHLSPLLLLAIVSDLAYGSKSYLLELAEELEKQGVIDDRSTIHQVDDLMEAIAASTKTAASAFDTPPLSVDGIKQTIDSTREAIASIEPTSVIPQNELENLWNDIHRVAFEQGVNPLAVSSAVTLFSLDKIATLGRGALSTVKAAGILFDRHIIDHYTNSLSTIGKKGIYASLSETTGPYIEAVWENFSTEKTTITEDVLSGKIFGRAWKKTRQWFGQDAEEKQDPDKPELDKQDSSSSEKQK